MNNSLSVRKDFSVKVSIDDASKAFLALRTYGLNEQVASEIILHETETVINDYPVSVTHSIAPYLIKDFGEQHIKEAITYAYLFVYDFDLDIDTYLKIMEVLLTAFRPEELITNPENIRYFISSLLNIVDQKTNNYISDENNNESLIELAKLTFLSSELDRLSKLPAEIKDMCQTPYSYFAEDLSSEN